MPKSNAPARGSRDPQRVTIECLEHGLVLLAYMMELDGPVHMPAFECLEEELRAARGRLDTMDRVRQIVEGRGLAGRQMLPKRKR
jgi:hypothetical protein